MSNILLSIIIVSYNTSTLTIQTLNSLVISLKKSQLEKKCEIIVVDNHSLDDSVKQIQQFAKKANLFVKLIINQKNLGFGTANNQAIKQALGKYLLFLNSDTIIQDEAIKQLLEFFEKHPFDDRTALNKSSLNKLDKLGILAADLRNQNGSFQAQGGDLPTLSNIFTQMLFIDDLPIIGKLFKSYQHTGRRSNKTTGQLEQKGWVAATAMMVSKQMLSEIGTFDENIFLYAEDVELCIRAKKHHYDIAIYHPAKVIHLQNQSSSNARALKGEFDGLIYIFSKHHPLWQMRILKLILKFGALLRICLFATMQQDQKKSHIYREIYQAI